MKKKALVISIINNKGGVGKTTSTAVIAELLAYLGRKVSDAIINFKRLDYHFFD